MYLTTFARDRKRAQTLRVDPDDVPSDPMEHWDDDDDDANCSDTDKHDVVDVPSEDHSLCAMYPAMLMLDRRTETVLFDRNICATTTRVRPPLRAQLNLRRVSHEPSMD